MKNSDDSRHRERVRRAEATARLLVDAGPGTGKTEMAAVRMASLIQTGLSPGHMLVLSFSRSAVRNLTHRLARVTDADDIAEDERPSCQVSYAGADPGYAGERGSRCPEHSPQEAG